MTDGQHNILMIKGNYGSAGGPESLLASLLRCIDQQKCIPTLLRLQKQGIQWARPLAKDIPGVASVTVPWRGILLSPLTARAVNRVAIETQADLINTHDMRSNLAAYMIRGRRIPWVAQIHGWLGHTHSGRWRYYEKMDRMIIRKADVVVVGSNAAFQEVQAAGAKKVCLVPNSVAIPHRDECELHCEEIRQQIGARRDSVVVGTVGRVHAGKGPIYLIEAIERLTRQGLPVKGLIVGDGPELESLRQLVIARNLTDSVILPGFCQEVGPYYSAMDIFVVPSLKESMPLTALEAMAMRRPIIASNVGGLPDVIKDGQNGLLVPPADSEALAAAIEKLMADRNLSEKLAGCGRETVVQKFSAEAMTRQLENVFQETIEESKSRA